MPNQANDASSHWEPFPKDVLVSVYCPPGADNDAFLIPVRHFIGLGLGTKPFASLSIASAYMENKERGLPDPCGSTTSERRVIDTEQVAPVRNTGSSTSCKPPRKRHVTHTYSVTLPGRPNLSDEPGTDHPEPRQTYPAHFRAGKVFNDTRGASHTPSSPTTHGAPGTSSTAWAKQHHAALSEQDLLPDLLQWALLPPTVTLTSTLSTVSSRLASTTQLFRPSATVASLQLFVNRNLWGDGHAHDAGDLTIASFSAEYDKDPIPSTRILRRMPNTLSIDWPRSALAVAASMSSVQRITAVMQVNDGQQVWTPPGHPTGTGVHVKCFSFQDLHLSPPLLPFLARGTQKLRDIRAGLTVLGLSALSFLATCLNSNWLLAIHDQREDAEDDHKRTWILRLVESTLHWVCRRCDLGSSGLQQAMQLSLV